MGERIEGEKMAGTAEFAHHMIKEIFEQPQALRDTTASRVSLEEAVVRLPEVRISPQELRSLRRINIVASGTSRHAGMAGQYMILELAGVQVDVDYASEFEYSNPLIGPGELTILITQSGETADTTGAQREAKLKGSRTVAISSDVDSTIAREADGVIYTHAGPEISIASTKAFSAQMAALFLFALYLGQVRNKVPKALGQYYIRELLRLADKIKAVLRCASQCEKLADKYHRFDDFLFLGRAIHYPIAMDDALKLKEVSYVHAEGYPAGETKHGPNALIDEHLPLVMIATCDRNDPGSVRRHEKDLANIRQFKEQSGRIIAIATEGDVETKALANEVVFVPQAPELLSPMLEIIPLQLFAYYTAVIKGLDVDRPRNLVKSVMQE